MSKEDILAAIDGLSTIPPTEAAFGVFKIAIQRILKDIVELGQAAPPRSSGSGGGSGGGGGGDSSGDVESTKARVEKLLASESSELNDWDRDFLNNVQSKSFFSDKMKAVVNKCYKKVYG